MVSLDTPCPAFRVFLSDHGAFVESNFRNADWNLHDNGTYQPPVKQCDNGSFCCGSANPSVSMEAIDCCNKNQGFFLDNGKVTPANASSSASPTPTSTLDVVTTSVLASSPSSSPSSSRHTGAEIGGVIAGVLGLILFVASLCLFLRRRKRHDPEAMDMKDFIPETAGTEAGGHRSHGFDMDSQLSLVKNSGDVIDADGGQWAGPMKYRIDKYGVPLGVEPQELGTAEPQGIAELQSR